MHNNLVDMSVNKATAAIVVVIALARVTIVEFVHMFRVKHVAIRVTGTIQFTKVFLTIKAS